MSQPAIQDPARNVAIRLVSHAGNVLDRLLAAAATASRSDADLIAAYQVLVRTGRDDATSLMRRRPLIACHLLLLTLADLTTSLAHDRRRRRSSLAFESVEQYLGQVFTHEIPSMLTYLRGNGCTDEFLDLDWSWANHYR